MTNLHLIGIVGSLRIESVNGAFAKVASSVLPNDATMSLHDITDVPLYNGDSDDEGRPESVAALHDAVGACDGLILFSPEYNGSFPAVTKNIIDWLSRPPRSWAGIPITMVTLSPGPRGGLGVRDHFSAIMAHQPTRLFETLGVGSYFDKLDADGDVSHPDTLTELTAFLSRFVDFCSHDDDA
jgi:chromate reductase, NAD(P)H dehydrogenase (quinone)